MLKSKLSRRVARKRRATSPRVQSAELLETKVLLSAASTDIQQGSSSEVTARIVNGNETSAYEAVGIVNNGCTGTLISPTHVLTAAHCTEGVGDRRGTFDVGGETYRTSDIIDHPDYNPNRFDVGYDISIMELDRPVTGITPMEIFRDTPEVGQLLTLVGFGEGGTSQGGSLNDFGNKRVGETEIDEVTNLHVSWDFDSHNESNTAPGDSGGPAFLTVGGDLFIAGVTSGGTGDAHDLGDFSFDTRVDTFASWIDGIVGDSGGGGDDGGGDDGGGDDGGGDNGGDDGRLEFTQDQGKNIREDRPQTLFSRLDVSGVDGGITDLNVKLDIDHTYTSDLVVHLIAPDGTKLRLFKAVGGDGENFSGTVLDDEASSSIKNADAPFDGTYKAMGKLSKFDGVDPNGEWKLRIRDRFSDDGGRLNSWTLSMETDGDNDTGGGGDDGGGSGNGSFTSNERVEIDADAANTVQSELTVNGVDGSISDINVTVDIDHTWDEDLLVTLVSPSGTRVQMIRYVGGDGDGFNNTMLDDSASVDIADGSAPFSGTFVPHQSLSAFDGEDANGVWTLVVRDNVAEDGGTLNSWTLDVETDGSRGRSADSLTTKQKEVRRFKTIKQEMRRGRITRINPAKAVAHAAQESGVEEGSFTQADWESYRQQKLQRYSDSVFAATDLEMLLGSL
ncbi:MAG: proprotein convertase P-domain-containing protein [Planctomycetaceae bacterium]